MNPLWGAPLIHGELLKLGIDVSQATVAKFMPRHRRPPSQTWRTFFTNHVGQITAADFFVVPTATCRLLLALVVLAHERRRVVHVAVTGHPTAAWTAQQLREAFPRDEVPRYLIRERDHAFAGIGPTATGMGIHQVLTAPRSSELAARRNPPRPSAARSAPAPVPPPEFRAKGRVGVGGSTGAVVLNSLLTMRAALVDRPPSEEPAQEA
jgi:hypothetical protein